jgi:cytochrome c-type biogenesis protein CcmH/NrfF
VIGMETLPLWTWFLGACLLGFILIYGILRNRRRTRGDRILTDEATRANYREENRRSGA